MRYLRAEEDADRANARVADKVMLALPRELSAKERVELVRNFAEEVTKGRAPWLAAFHDKGEDRRNPHCHLVIRDRDPQTKRRVIGMSEAGSTEMLRKLWEQHANRALKAAGSAERIDRRTLAAQGIERTPTIHEGPRAQEMDARGAHPRSRVIDARNGRGAKRRARRIDYGRIDQGISRPAYNRAIRDRQKEAEYWSAIDADKQRRDFESLGYTDGQQQAHSMARADQRDRERVRPGNPKPTKQSLTSDRDERAPKVAKKSVVLHSSSQYPEKDNTPTFSERLARRRADNPSPDVKPLNSDDKRRPHQPSFSERMAMRSRDENMRPPSSSSFSERRSNEPANRTSINPTGPQRNKEPDRRRRR